MKSAVSAIILAMLLLSAVTTAYVPPCYNAADPDAGFYAPGPNSNDCSPPGVNLGFCP
ncbi:hypothetical protein BKA61DRAFT_664604 [Leptodontidium sp. MPI-SDFR-AT-0119]|nr:hypothetical protein BKA61DRAFT_664604 [Leptodontidium sp. MPI-SDFR-AT-0119]